MVAYSDAFFPTHPLRLAGICQLSGTESPIIDKCPCCLSPLPPPWLYARESGCVFYPIGVIPHVAAGSPKTIICLCLSGWYDAFGELYMSCIAGNARKQSNGQFFTPAHICDLMAELCGSQDNSVELCGDPACGSGRNLLAWHVKHLSSYLCAEDIDRTCCLMTVCNFLIHGCVGEVIWHDSLNPDTYYDGWKVNERLAITGLPTIRRIAKEESVVWRTWQNQRDDAKGHVITPIKKINIRKKREEAKRMQLDLFD